MEACITMNIIHKFITTLFILSIITAKVLHVHIKYLILNIKYWIGLSRNEMKSIKSELFRKSETDWPTGFSLLHSGHSPQNCHLDSAASSAHPCHSSHWLPPTPIPLPTDSPPRASATRVSSDIIIWYSYEMEYVSQCQYHRLHRILQPRRPTRTEPILASRRRELRAYGIRTGV